MEYYAAVNTDELQVHMLWLHLTRDTVRKEPDRERTPTEWSHLYKDYKKTNLNFIFRETP